jgi:hypothetical protein
VKFLAAHFSSAFSLSHIQIFCSASSFQAPSIYVLTLNKLYSTSKAYRSRVSCHVKYKKLLAMEQFYCILYTKYIKERETQISSVHKFLLWNYSCSNKKLNSVAWVRERTIPAEQPPLIVEVSANFCW